MKARCLCFALICLLAFPLASQATTRVLIIDYLMSDPLVFSNFFRHLPQPEFEVSYRRYYPALVKNDATYQIIILAASRHPFPSAAKMTLAEAEFLRDYVKAGGILVSLYSSEENDRLILNQLFKDLSLAVRIEGKAIFDPVNGYRSTLVPSSYYLNPPLLAVSPETPLGNGLEKICGGKSFSLLVGQADNISIPVFSFESSLRMDGFKDSALSGIKGLEGQFLGGCYSVGVMAICRAEKGYVVLLPRYLINMTGYTGRWSDKPVIPTGFLEENKVFELNFVEYIKSLARGDDIFKPYLPLARADQVDKWDEKLEKVALEPGELRDVEAADVYEKLNFLPEKKRSLDIRNPHLKALSEQKIRSVFFHLELEFRNPESIRRAARYLSEAGFNLIEGMLGRSPYDGLKSEESKREYLQNIRAILDIMKEHNIKVYAGSYFPYGLYYQKKAYSRMVSSSGAESGFPSPLDRAFWRDAFLPLAIELAKLSREYPETLLGMLWDLELYYFDTVALNEAYTFDNIAWDVFLNKRRAILDRLRLFPEASRLPQYLRFAWLRDKGMLKSYYRMLEEETADIGRWLDSEVNKVNRNFLWGFYTPGIVENWFYNGLFRALSSPQRPLVLITYESRGMQQTDYNAQRGIYFLHCPGILLNTLKGNEWSQSLPGLAMNEDGYWLYQGFQLFKEDDWRLGRGDFTLRQPPAELRNALQKANQTLDQALKKR